MDSRIYIATVEDIDTIVNMQVLHYDEKGDVFPVTFNRDKAFHCVGLAIDKGDIVMVMEGDLAVGYCWCEILSMHYTDDLTMHEHYTYIYKEYRCSVHYFSLIEFMRDKAIANGCKVLQVGGSEFTDGREVYGIHGGIKAFSLYNIIL